MPGVQNPHCKPCRLRNPSCTGCHWFPAASPSIVVTEEPSTEAARTVHDFTESPSTSTVQAPHEVVSQPILVAVRLSVSRSRWTSSVRSGTSTLRSSPLTVMLRFTLAPFRLLSGLPARHVQRSWASRYAEHRDGKARQPPRSGQQGSRRSCRPPRCP